MKKRDGDNFEGDDLVPVIYSIYVLNMINLSGRTDNGLVQMIRDLDLLNMWSKVRFKMKN